MLTISSTFLPRSAEGGATAVVVFAGAVVDVEASAPPGAIVLPRVGAAVVGAPAAGASGQY